MCSIERYGSTSEIPEMLLVFFRLSDSFSYHSKYYDTNSHISCVPPATQQRGVQLC